MLKLKVFAVMEITKSGKITIWKYAWIDKYSWIRNFTKFANELIIFIEVL